MIFIRALIWKRYIEIKNSKKLWSFLLIPVFCLLIFSFLNMPHVEKFFYFCPLATYLNFFTQWNSENVIYSGYMLATPITARKNWINNAIIITISGYVYSFFILILSLLINDILIQSPQIYVNLFYLSFCNFPIAFSLVLSNTICNVDYSPIKQFIQIIFVLVGVLFFATAFLYSSFFFNNAMIFAILSLVLILLCFLINRKDDNESLFINTLKVINELGTVIDD